VSEFTGNGIAALEVFVAEHGHAGVPVRFRTEEGFWLGAWCDVRRQERRKGRLSAERVAALDALGFVWDPPRGGSAGGWKVALRALEAFVAEHGHARVPQTFRTADGFRLGSWCSGQRCSRRKGKLLPEREAALDTLGFVWDPPRSRIDDAWWQVGFAALEAFVAEHGHARVPQAFRTADGYRLGQWCTRRRQERRNGRLSAERIAALDALGFVWDPSCGRSGGWDAGLAALEAFVAEHGHARVPQAFRAADGFRLGQWCTRRRQERRNGWLSAEREASLDALGFVWDPSREKSGGWETALAALEAFVAEHGHGQVPQAFRTADGHWLGQWCTRRRQERRNGWLSAERIAALDALGFVWDPPRGAPPRGAWQSSH
jgi:hypothetical protein